MAKHGLKLSFDIGEYTPFYAWQEPTRTQEEIVKEYSRLRSIERKRINRLVAAGFVTPERAAQRMSYLPTVAQIKAKGDATAVGKALVYAYSAVTRGETVTSSRQRLREIKERLGQEIAPAELETFDNFMRAWRLYAPGGVESTRAASDYTATYSNSGAESVQDFWANYEIYKQRGGMYK